MTSVLRIVFGIGLAPAAALALVRATSAQDQTAEILPRFRVVDTPDGLQPVPLTLFGQVLDAEERPAGNARVASSAGGSARTDASGFFRLELEVPPDATSLELFAASGAGRPRSGEVRVGLAPRARQMSCPPLRLTVEAASTPSWLPTFGERPGVTGLSSRFVLTSAEYDDGTGPALYVGGEFLVAGSADADYVGRWNGQRWEGLASGLNGRPSAMIAFDDGGGSELFVGGLFTRVDGRDTAGIARWNGTRWDGVGAPDSLGTTAFAVHDDGGGPALYMAGSTRVNGIFVGRILRWDGATWTPIGGAFGGQIRALASFDDGTGPALWAGGSFDQAGGVPATHLARWTGQGWEALPSEVNSSVNALCVHDDGRGPALYVGGFFVSVGGLTVNRIARWDGQVWEALGGGTSASVRCLGSFDDGGGPALYAGGDFLSADGTTVNLAARWDGANWSALDEGLGGADGTLPVSVNTLTSFRENGVPTLFAGGSFARAGALGVGFAAGWRNDAWTPLGRGLSGTVSEAVVFDDGRGPALHACGLFGSAGDQPLGLVARWDGTGWSPLGGGLAGSLAGASALAVFDDGTGPALYVGGRFSLAGGVPVSNVARWDGTSWASPGTGLGGPVTDLAVYDDGSGPVLVACGDFTQSGSRGVACWNGTSWSGLAGGMDSRVSCLAVYDDGSGPKLFAGGPFTMAGGVSALHLARWNGSVWAPVTSGIQGVVGSLAVHDDGSGPALYVGGNFFRAGNVNAQNVARWNGTRWNALGSGTNSTVWALTSHDDGSGPALYAGGLFTTAGGMAISRVARWDGSSWSPLQGGIGAGESKGLFTLLSFDDGHGPTLYAGGEFWNAGHSGDGNLARWGAANRSAFVLDFETEDDFATPLVNGQHLDVEFGRLVTITSSGPNAGLGLFDSTVGGPNDPSQDRDLLVGSGNLLILQTENFPPNAADVFPRPNDDEDGGTMTLRFAQPLEPLSMALVDIDAGDGTSSVALQDLEGRTRTFTVPPNWTGDRLVAGPGRGVLRLDTLDPQPGWGSTATAIEDPDFDPFAVIRLSFHLVGSGAIDDVTLAGENLAVPRATVRTRNGAGVNPLSLRTSRLPVLGSTWSSLLDCSEVGPGVALLEVRRSAVERAPTPFGQLLIGGALVYHVRRPQTGASTSLAWDLPLDMTLVGLEVHAQGLCLGRADSAGHAAWRRALYSNALDLRLGF